MEKQPTTPVSSEEAGKLGESMARAGILEEKAKLLKKNWKRVAQLYPDLYVPGDDEEKYFRDLAVASSAHAKGNLIAKTKNGGTHEIDLDDLDKKLSRYAPDIKASLGIESVRGQAPGYGAIDGIARGVGDAIRNNTGDLPFLGGASFMNFLKGLFTWVTNGFKGGLDGLMKTVTLVTADNMRKDVTRNLTELSQESPQMASLLTPVRIAEISTKVKNTVLRRGGFAVQEQTTPSLRETRSDAQLVVDMDKMRESIYSAIKGEKITLEERIATKVEGFLTETKQNANFVKRMFMPGETEITATSKQVAGVLAPAIAESMSKTVTDAKLTDAKGRTLANLPKEEYAALVADKVTADTWKVAQNHFGTTLDKLSSEEQDKLRNGFRHDIQVAVGKEYGNLVMASSAAVTQSMPAIPEGTVTAKLTGATNVDEMPAAPAHTASTQNAPNSGRG